MSGTPTPPTNPKQQLPRSRRRKSRGGFSGAVLCFAVLLAGLMVDLIRPVAVGASKSPGQAGSSGGQQMVGVPIKPVARAVVNFEELARQEALKPPATRVTPRVIHPPKSAPPEPDVPSTTVIPPAQPDVPVEPLDPSPSPSLDYLAEPDQAQGGGLVGTWTIPPDTHGAVGNDAVNRVMAGLNNNYRIRNKSTGADVSTVSIETFWASTGATDVFDPRTIYDPYNDRWLLCAVSGAATVSSSILIGVSSGSDPGGTYFLYMFDADAPSNNEWADFPTLGFNKNWFVVSVNMFPNAGGSFTEGRILVIDYPDLRTGPVTPTSTYITGITGGVGGFCMHPATTYSSTEGTEYLVSHMLSSTATYRLSTITGTPSAPVLTIGAVKTRMGGEWVNPSGNILPQQCLSSCPGSLLFLESSDAQVRGNVVFRPGFGGSPDGIWYAQTVGLPSGGMTHTAVQWTKIDTAGDFVQGGRVDDATATSTNGGRWYAYPSISVNKFEDVLLGFSEFESDDFVDAGYTFHARTDPNDTMRDPIIFKEGEDYYEKTFGSGRNRWGDYSHTMVDPANDVDLWTIQEYTRMRAAPTVGGSDSKWGTWWAKVSLSPTAAKVSDFKATKFDDGNVLIEWQSAHEVNNLGFNIYREQNGRKVRVTPQLVAGSALVTGPGTSLTAGGSYAWIDTPADGNKSSRYWLEDVDLNGKSTWTGPVEASRSAGRTPSRRQAELLARLGQRQAQLTLGLGSTAVRSSASLAEQQERTGPAFAQAQLAGTPAVKISVNQEGWYRATQPELVAVGISSATDPRLLRMFVDGIDVPIKVTGEADGKFDPGDAVEFYGLGLDTPSTDARTYWLVEGDRPGLRIELVETKGGPTAGSSFSFTVERRDKSVYFSSLLNGEAENFFGAVIAGEPVVQTVALSRISRTVQSTAEISVAVQGVTLGAHRVRVLLNGVALGEISFNGQSQGVLRVPISPQSLKEGANEIRLSSLGGPGDVSLADYIRITYPRSYTAESNVLRMTAPGSRQVTVDGFTSAAIRVVDATDPGNVEEVSATVKPVKGGYAATFTAPGNGQRTLLAFADSEVSSPAAITRNEPSKWRQAAQGADLLIVASREFFPALGPLTVLRRSQGLSVAIADIEDVYDEFSFGHKSPTALRDFFTYATTTWKKRPRSVLLAGDASFDPRNYLGFGSSDIVPTQLIDTSYMETASDDWLVDSSADGIADVAIGRLAVRTPKEAAALVSKIVRYESSGPSESLLLVSDQADVYNFEDGSAELRELIPDEMRVEEIRRSQMDVATARALLFEHINNGQAIVNYLGHGSVDLWRNGLLTAGDVQNLSNGDRLPLFVLMTCLNGYFQDAALDSLAEALIKAESGGAVAVWGSSGMTRPEAQAKLNREAYRLLFSEASVRPTLGEALKQAKAAVADLDVRRTWVLLGDPTMRLR
jgi:hypothetical protein